MLVLQPQIALNAFRLPSELKILSRYMTLVEGEKTVQSRKCSCSARPIEILEGPTRPGIPRT